MDPTSDVMVNRGNFRSVDTPTPVITLEYPRFSCTVRACKADYHVEDLAHAFQEEPFVRGVLNNAQI